MPAHCSRQRSEAKPACRIGLITDLHYADKVPTKTRFYRETFDKLTEAVRKLNAEQPAFAVELGDLIDKATSVDEEIAWLKKIETVFAQTKAARHYVLGNHCVATLTKAEFAAHTAAARTPHYSFDRDGFHFVILDACYTADGTPYQRDNFDWKDANLPPEELTWLREDLSRARHPVIVFAHQRLDEKGPHSVRNAPVRARDSRAVGARCWPSFKATHTRTTTSRSPASTTARSSRWSRGPVRKTADTACSTSCPTVRCACTVSAGRRVENF